MVNDAPPHSVFSQQRQNESCHIWTNKPIMDKIKVLDKEPGDLHRNVLEAVHITLR